MYLDTKQPKKHQQKFKKFLLTKEDQERIAEQKKYKRSKYKLW